MMVEPISPEYIIEFNAYWFPNFVIDVWNKEIANNYNGIKSIVNCKNIRIKLENACLKNKVSYCGEFLDIEEIYRKRGWEVTLLCYETSSPYFEFKPVKKYIFTFYTRESCK